MKENKGRIILVVLICLFLLGGLLLSNKQKMSDYTEYKCDVKSLRLSTTIDIDKDNKEFVKVKGNIFKVITDPLKMYDLNENQIAYADDSYHLIKQDSHSIFVNGNLSVEMVGLVKLFGEEYEIYNENGEKIARVTFNMFNTNGNMYDMEENLIADFNSKFLFNDFKVRITRDCNLDEKTVLMIFCSYYSDQKADSSSSKK